MTGSQVASQVVGLAVRSSVSQVGGLAVRLPVRWWDWQSGSQSGSGTGSQVACQVGGLAVRSPAR